MPAHKLCHSKRSEAESDKKMICEGARGGGEEECNQQGIASAVGIVAVSATFSIVIQSVNSESVIFPLRLFFGCILGPFLELEYFGLRGVETYYLFKNPF